MYTPRSNLRVLCVTCLTSLIVIVGYHHTEIEEVVNCTSQYADHRIRNNTKDETEAKNTTQEFKILPPCEKTISESYMIPDINETSYEEALQLYPNLENGTWKSRFCSAADSRVAIIVPYRNRAAHLYIFLKHMHGFLQAQNRDYAILIVEQFDKLPFNRGSLFNAGFLESLKMSNFTCFVLHDIDLLPENLNLTYTCEQNFVDHYAEYMSRYDYKIWWEPYAGGVLAIHKLDYEKVNGFGNIYWGWGAEDDDFSLRVQAHKIPLRRARENNLGRFKTVSHEEAEKNPNRYDLLGGANSRLTTDGVNSINYTVHSITHFQLYIRVRVNFEVMYCPNRNSTSAECKKDS